MFAHKYVMRVSASLVFFASSFISVAIMARYVGEAYGMMMWGMAFVAILNNALDLGFYSANIKKISEGKDLNKCVSTYLAISIAVSTITVCLVLVSFLAIGLLGDSLPTEFWAVAAVFVGYFILNNMNLVVRGTFTGRMEGGKESIILTTEYLVRSAILIILAVLGTSAVVLSLGYVIGSACALLVALTLFRPLKVKLTRPAFFKEYSTFIVPLAVPMVLFAIIAYLDRMMIGVFYDELEVAFYAAAMGIVYAFVTIGVVMNGLLLSHMSKLDAKEKKDEARNTLWAAQKYLAVLMLPATVFLFIFGNETSVALFSDGFAASGPIMSVLALYIFLAVLAGLFSQVLLSMNRTVRYGRVATVHAIATILLFLILIPGSLFGSMAAGTGAALSLVLGNLLFVLLLIASIRRIGAPGIYPRLFIHVAAALVLAGLLYLVKIYLEPSGLISLALLSLVSITVYVIVLAAVKEISKKDVHFIRDAMSPKNLYEDLMDEIKNER